MSVAFKEYPWILTSINFRTRWIEEIKLWSETDLKPGSLET